MQKPLVSVIIPIYRTGRYLDQCVKSVIEQDYENWEAILIDDGSHDGSLETARQWESLDKRIRVIARPHEGLPKTRRTGLDAARGFYVQHLDSDDWLLPNALSGLVACAESTGADIVSAPFLFAWPDGTMQPSKNPDFVQMRGREYLRGMLAQHYYWSIWSHFHRRELYFEKSVEVMPEICMGEDGIMMLQLMARNPLVVAYDRPTLYYRQNEQSVTFDPERQKARIEEFRAWLEWVKHFAERENLTEKYAVELEICKCAILVNISKNGDYSNLRAALRHAGKIRRVYPAFSRPFSIKIRHIINEYSRFALLGDLRYLYYRITGKI